MVNLPAEVTELKQRIEMLERRLAGGGDICPRCKEPTFNLTNSAPDPIFGAAGGQRRTYECSKCGFNESKIVT